MIYIYPEIGYPPIGGGSRPRDADSNSEFNLKDLLKLEDLAELTGFHSASLRKLLNTGKIRGVKIGEGQGGTWLTTIKVVEEYKKQVKGKGGRPRK